MCVNQISRSVVFSHSLLIACVASRGCRRRPVNDPAVYSRVHYTDRICRTTNERWRYNGGNDAILTLQAPAVTSHGASAELRPYGGIDTCYYYNAASHTRSACRCGLFLQMSHVAWSVCLSVLVRAQPQLKSWGGPRFGSTPGRLPHTPGKFFENSDAKSCILVTTTLKEVYIRANNEHGCYHQSRSV